MLRTAALAMVISSALVSCAADRSSTGQGGSGGKADGDDEDLDCLVVWVNEDLNGDLFEEGFGSVYDIDEEGYLGMDEDSIDVGVRATDDGGLQAELGQTYYDAEDGARVKQISETPESNKDIEFESYEIHQADSAEIFTIRVFSDTRLGVVLYRADKDADQQTLARIDCRGLERPAFNF
jgi:hypothetical protein